MSLKLVHIFFITVCTLFALGFAIWCFQDFSTTGNNATLALGIASALFLIPISLYARWFWRKSRKLPETAVFAAVMVGGSALIPQTGWTCAVCFGDPNSLLSQGAIWGVFALCAVICVLLMAIGGIALTWTHRARKMS